VGHNGRTVGQASSGNTILHLASGFFLRRTRTAAAAAKGSPFTYPIAILLSSRIAANVSSTIHGDMSEDKKFKNVADLKAWLITKGVDEEDVTGAADILLTREFNKPSKLIGISSTQLESQGINTPR
jgi:hypothetical protein